MRKPVAFACLLACLAVPAVALAQARASYEPSQRLRTSLETCRKSEVENGAYCVMKCAPDFRMEFSSKKPMCVATKPGARYEPPKPSYTPPPPPQGPRPPGA